MRTTLCAFVFTLAAAAVPVRASAEELAPAASPSAGPPPAEIRLEAPAQSEAFALPPALARRRNLQTAGQIVLGGALALVITGVALIEVDPYAMKFGDWGFAATGVGVGAFVASAFLLGFSRPVHVRDHPWEKRRAHSLAAAPLSGGLGAAYSASF
jgi:hypothetical protein